MKPVPLVIVVLVFLSAGWALSAAAGFADPMTRGHSRGKRSDDVSLQSLEAVVQQQAAALQSLQATVTALQNRLPASFQPVAFTTHYSHDSVSLGQHSILQFDYVPNNAGNGYDPHTGIFTAPVAGVYTFFLSVMSHNDHGPLELAITKGGNTVLDLVWTLGSAVRDNQGSSQVTTPLAVGEQVWVRQEAGDMVRGLTWTVFTGFLVQAN